MNELALAGLVMRHLLIAATTMGMPPTFSGAFWGLLCLYGVVSIFFDDGVHRGTPGIGLFYSLRKSPPASSGS